MEQDERERQLRAYLIDIMTDLNTIPVRYLTLAEQQLGTDYQREGVLVRLLLDLWRQDGQITREEHVALLEFLQVHGGWVATLSLKLRQLAYGAALRDIATERVIF